MSCEFVDLSDRPLCSAIPHLVKGVMMTKTLRSLAMMVVPVVMVMATTGCSVTRGKCRSCDVARSAPSSCQDYQSGGGFSAPAFAPNPIPVPPAELPTGPVPPPPTGAAARPNMIQRMQGSTTAFFLNANENVRRTFHR